MVKLEGITKNPVGVYIGQDNIQYLTDNELRELTKIDQQFGSHVTPDEHLTELLEKKKTIETIIERTQFTFSNSLSPDNIIEMFNYLSNKGYAIEYENIISRSGVIQNSPIIDKQNGHSHSIDFYGAICTKDSMVTFGFVHDPKNMDNYRMIRFNQPDKFPFES